MVRSDICIYLKNISEKKLRTKKEFYFEYLKSNLFVSMNVLKDPYSNPEKLSCKLIEIMQRVYSKEEMMEIAQKFIIDFFSQNESSYWSCMAEILFKLLDYQNEEIQREYLFKYIGINHLKNHKDDNSIILFKNFIEKYSNPNVVINYLIKHQIKCTEEICTYLKDVYHELLMRNYREYCYQQKHYVQLMKSFLL